MMTEPEIAFVTEFCPPYRTGFFERFAQRFDVEYFFCNQNDSWRAYGDFAYTEVSGIDVRERYRVAPALFGYLFKKRPDLIIGSPVEGFGGQASYLYARITNTPFVLWTGEWHLPLTTLRTTTFPLIRRLYRGADAITVYGPHIEEYLSELGVDDEKISVGWNTVDAEKFTNPGPNRRREILDDMGIPEDAPVALYVGRHVKAKGLEDLVNAFEKATSVMDETPYLVLVGDGPLRQKLVNQASGMPNVVFPGYVKNDDLAGYYAIADVFALPSIQTHIFREPWGLVVNEAMSSGTAIIATNQVGASAAGVVQDGENGFVIPERNVSVLCEKLVKILSDSALAREMGASAAETIAEYDYDRMVDGFETAIETATRKY
jgi:glycosyltransferase involved in cell wall biosynthesis